jgi:predicted phosphoribosyltransferase
MMCQAAGAAGARRIAPAAPVGPPDVIETLRRDAVEAVCPAHPGAGTLDQVAELAVGWFTRHLVTHAAGTVPPA